jgi:hypothetical protein
MSHFVATCEVWVKPMFGKARPVIKETAWNAPGYPDFLRLLQTEYKGKRWKLLSWRPQ